MVSDITEYQAQNGPPLRRFTVFAHALLSSGAMGAWEVEWTVESPFIIDALTFWCATGPTRSTSAIFWHSAFPAKLA